MRQATCTKCQRAAWVNACTRGGSGIGEYCADCFEIIKHDENRSKPSSRSSGPNHNDPGFDNVIRAMEEDR